MLVNLLQIIRKLEVGMVEELEQERIMVEYKLDMAEEEVQI